MATRNAISGRKVAICIGINRYPGSNSDLNGCVNDARDWAAALAARGFEAGLLLDDEATGNAIRASLKSLAKSAKADDTVVITFSGHGSFVPDEDGDEDDDADECWCPHDVVSNGPITDDELHTIFSSRADGVRWIVLSDSCHSGTVARFSPILTPATTLATDAPKRLVRFLPPSVFLRHHGQVQRLTPSKFVKASPPGRHDALLLAGCQDSEYSFDAWFQGRPNGAFTYVALHALRELSPTATYSDWYQRIRAALPSQQYPQTPSIFGTKTMMGWTTFSGEIRDDLRETPRSTSRPIDVGVSDSWDVGKELAYTALATRPRTAALRRAPRTPLVAEGDSWFDYPWNDVLTCLEDHHNYDVTSLAHKGDTAEDMAYSGGQLAKLVRGIDKLIVRGETPRAILLSGGGNDVAGDEFAQLLNHRASASRGLNESVVAGVIDRRIRDCYTAIIAAVTAICEERLGRRVPIIVHGYGYAVPDGRGFLGGWWFLPGPWLKPGFDQKGYSDGIEMQAIVDVLIDRFNEMQKRLIASQGFEHVRHVDVREVLPRVDHVTWWDNELHPTVKGFRAVADAFAKVLESV